MTDSKPLSVQTLSTLLESAFQAVNETALDGDEVQYSSEMVLTGPNATIESLTLINALLEFERLLLRDYGSPPNLFDMASESEGGDLSAQTFLNRVASAY